MQRIPPREAAFRGYGSATRGVVTKADDNHNMQELDSGMMHSDSRKGIERAQDYGFVSVPLPSKPDENEGAEAFFTHPSGNRAHPVAVVVADRRHRPYGLKEGESALHDDQGQMLYAARDG